MINVISVDLEDWYQTHLAATAISKDNWNNYAGRLDKNTYKLLDIFRQNNVSATFFVLACNAKRYPNLILDIKKRGHEIALHGLNHDLVYTQHPERFERELREAKNILENITEDKILGFRAPNWSINSSSSWAISVLEKMGFRYSSSLPYKRLRDSIKDRYNILEIPRSSINIFGKDVPFGGGLFLRIYPYKLTAKMIKITNAKGELAVVYLHPWEFDKYAPQFTPSPIKNFLQYANISTTITKLRQLLNDFKFDSIRNIFFK